MPSCVTTRHVMLCVLLLAVSAKDFVTGLQEYMHLAQACVSDPDDDSEVGQAFSTFCKQVGAEGHGGVPTYLWWVLHAAHLSYRQLDIAQSRRMLRLAYLVPASKSPQKKLLTPPDVVDCCQT